MTWFLKTFCKGDHENHGWGQGMNQGYKDPKLSCFFSSSLSTCGTAGITHGNGGPGMRSPKSNIGNSKPGVTRGW